MDLKKEQLQYIRKAFQRMKSKQDLLNLINYCKPLLYTNNSFPISLSQLTYHSNTNIKAERYNKFIIKKRSGEERVIHSPNSGLKCIQRCLNLVFQTIYEPSVAANGYVKGRSILDNALVHSGYNYLYNIDLKDFFSSIDQARIWGRLQSKPFNLNKHCGRLELANIIASICCYEMDVERIGSDGQWHIIKKNVLPQGAPTSPTLTNIICQQLDYYLSAAAKRFGLNYSRYADDISFSSMHNVYQENSDFIVELQRIITAHNFHIKKAKTRLQTREYRQKVTGLIVNKKPNLPAKYLKDIKMWLYFWEIYGYEKANSFFIKELGEITNRSEKLSGELLSVLTGKINYLKMIKGVENNSYQKIKKKFNHLLLNDKKKTEFSKPEDNTTDIQIVAEQVGKVTLPIFHDPYALVEILKMFSVDNSILKYATHTWDAGKDENKFDGYDDFIKKAKKEFNQISNKLKALNPRLWAKILAFLFQQDIKESGWGTHRIKFGWSSPEIQNSLIKNPNVKPENIFIPEYAQFVFKNFQGNQTIQIFKQVIDIFKNEIEIRDENSALLNIILEFHDHYLEGFKILAADNLENKSFYIDVDYFRKVLVPIFQSIQSRNQFNEVSYLLVENSSTYTLSIVHHNSYCRGFSINDERFSLNKGDFATIKNQLTNLCDWSIESEFLEGAYRLNFLVSAKDVPSSEKIQKTDGFKYILTFYK